MATAVVKWDSKGNPIAVKGGGGEKGKRRRLVKLDFGKALESSAPAIGYGLVGAVVAGVGHGVVSMVPTLRRWAGEGPTLKRAAVVGLVSVGVAGAGLMVMSKVSTPKKAMEAAPFVLGGVVLVSFGPTIAVEVVERIDSFMRGFMSTAVTPAGGGRARIDGGARMRPRPALTPDQVIEQQVPRQGHARRW